MEEAAELPLDRLAHCAGVSQPTVLRMLKALGFDGYKDFRYQLVAELARLQPGQDQADQLMYGYTLSRQDTLEEIPVNMTATTQRMLEETLKNFSGKDISESAVEALTKCPADRYLRRGKFGGDGAGSADQAALSGAALPAFQRLLSPADRGREPDVGGCGGGDLLFRGVEGYGGRAAARRRRRARVRW